MYWIPKNRKSYTGTKNKYQCAFFSLLLLIYEVDSWCSIFLIFSGLFVKCSGYGDAPEKMDPSMKDSVNSRKEPQCGSVWCPMDSRLRGNDEERLITTQSWSWVPAIPAQVSPPILAQAGIHTGALVMKQPVLCIMASNLKNRRWEPRTWLSGNSGKQVNKRREWKSPGCWARSALLSLQFLCRI